MYRSFSFKNNFSRFDINLSSDGSFLIVTIHATYQNSENAPEGDFWRELQTWYEIETTVRGNYELYLKRKIPSPNRNTWPNIQKLDNYKRYRNTSPQLPEQIFENVLRADTNGLEARRNSTLTTTTRKNGQKLSEKKSEGKSGQK